MGRASVEGLIAPSFILITEVFGETCNSITRKSLEDVFLRNVFPPGYHFPSKRECPPGLSATVQLPIFGDVSQTVDPDNSNNPCSVPTRAQIRGSYSVSDGLLSYNFTFGSNAPSFDDSKLYKGGAATLLHFHGPAARGQAVGNPIAVSSTVGSFPLSPEEVREVEAGRWYINIHSDSCPNGELRAQLDLIGTPGFTSAQLAGGLPVFGDVRQTVDPDNFNYPCVFPSRAQIRGTYAFDAKSLLFKYRFTFGDNAPGFDNSKLFSDGSATLLHFHGPAPRGQAVGNPVAVTSTTGEFSLTAEQGAEVQAGLWYINIHSNACPNGELRAQLDVIRTGKL